VRYLRVTLSADSASDAIVALLGHELRHALEAADAPEAVDQLTYRALYHVIGHASCAPPRWCFDTADAVRAGAEVYTELHAGRERSARLPAAEDQERGDD
jgi:hypothetical protein